MLYWDVERLLDLTIMPVSIPQIIQYQGSKRLLAPLILQYFPKHARKLWEPFSGMAAITIAAAKQRKADTYHLNDINMPLVKILQATVERPQQLLDEYTIIWEEQVSYSGGAEQHFYKIRDEFNTGRQDAARLLYLIARCVKGAVRYGSDGKFNQSPDKRRHGTKPSLLRSRLYEISALLCGKTTFSAVDYREIFEQAEPGDLVYMDPPDQGVSNVRDKRYFSGVPREEFAIALEILNRKKINFLISYDGSCGDKTYGEELPAELGCHKILLHAGYSSQATLLGRKEETVEALYVSQELYREYSMSAIVARQPELNFECAI